MGTKAKTYNTQQIEYLNIIIEKGNKEKNYEIKVNDIIELSNNKSDLSVRSGLTSSTMKELVLYNCKSKSNPIATVQLLHKDIETNKTIDTSEKVKKILQENKTKEEKQDKE